MTRIVRLLLLLQVITIAVGMAVVCRVEFLKPDRSGGVVAAVTVAMAEARVAAAPAPLSRRATPTAPTAKPAPPQPAHRATRKASTHRAQPVVRTRTRSAAIKRPAAGSTALQRMQAAVARIPGYRPGAATWYLIAKDGYWGTADWYHNVIYISPAVPARRIYDVVAHEWAHLLSVKAYGSVTQANDAMNAYFGGDGVTGAETAADCMALRLGAVWTHYTSCTNAHWRAGAVELLAGRRV